MKEINKEKIKKFIITFSVLVAVFLLTTLVGYIIEIKFLGDSSYSYVDYLLYLIGYGSLDRVDAWFRLFFSVGSLLALTLFSSACTVTWLESRRILKLDDKITVASVNDNEFIAKIALNSKKRDIYGAKVTLLVNVNGKSFSQETEVAYIPKSQKHDAIFTIELNSVIYKYFSEFNKNPLNVSSLVAMVTYSDVLSGTEFTAFEKFDYKNELNFNFECEEKFLAFINQSKFNVDFSNAQILDSKSPERSQYNSQQGFNVDFSLSGSYTDCDFQMLYLPIPEVTEWGVYHDLNCKFFAKLNVPQGVTVEVQIKKNDGSILNIENSGKLTSKNSQLAIDLSNYKRSTWENIKELCFTVFYKEVTTQNKTAKITVEECSFILPETK